ncbi:hypothetical protein PS1_045029 [Malus domestica]
MASISGIYSASPTITRHLKPASSLRKDPASVSVAFHGRVKSADHGFALSVAREVSAELTKTTDGAPSQKKGLVKDPHALWRRYVDWLYQHKELRLFLDVSRVGSVSGTGSEGDRVKLTEGEGVVEDVDDVVDDGLMFIH